MVAQFSQLPAAWRADAAEVVSIMENPELFCFRRTKVDEARRLTVALKELEEADERLVHWFR